MTLESLHLGAVRPDDFAALASFLRANDVPEVTNQFHPFRMDDASAEFIARGVHKDRYFVAWLEDRIVGLSMLRGWDEGYEVPSFGIVIDRRYHGLGIGGKLTDFTLVQAGRSGAARVRLSVYERNGTAYAMYLARGFRDVSRETVLRAGEPDTRIVMFKDLTEATDGTARSAREGDCA